MVRFRVRIWFRVRVRLRFRIMVDYHPDELTLILK
jgi:hypothetical protein